MQSTEPASNPLLTGFTWSALILAAAGTLLAGVILPIWLPNMGQAVQLLLR